MPGFPTTANNSGKRRTRPLTSVRNGLIGEFLFGRDLATSQVNSGLGGGTALPVGSGAAPIYGDHQIELGNGMGVDSGLAMPSGAQTIILVANVQATDAASVNGYAIMSGRSNSTAGAFSILNDPSVTSPTSFRARMIDTTSSDAILPSPPARPLNALRCFIASVSGAGQGATITFGEYQGGAMLQQGTAALAVARTNPAGVNMVTGNSSTVGAGGNWQSRLLYTVRLDYNRELTSTEKMAAYLDLRSALATMGKYT